MKETYSQQDLVDFKPQHDLFFGIDSDGCVFDSMTIKQRVFREGVIEFWGLESAADDVRRVCEWVGLFSPWRGLNRFQLILKFFQALGNCVAFQGFASQGQKKVQGLEKLAAEFPSMGSRLPTKALEEFVKSGVTLSMPELEKWIEQTGSTELVKVLEWSAEMSRRISELPPIPVFDEAFRGLEKLREVSDLIVVSQTTEDALVREWRHAELEHFVDVIAGAELGSKAESLMRAAAGRYPLDRIVMVGDAPGDLEAAQAIGCLFFPIIPGDEVASWIELREVALAKILNGTFADTYQDELIARFNAVLSPTPPF
jgi:phosphoglycolate phosphatase-like HAD superfamily hydrolase